MKPFKRTVVTIARNPGKNFVIFLVIFILGVVLSGAISIRRGIHNTEGQLMRGLPPIAMISDTFVGDERVVFSGNRELWEGELTAGILTEIGALPYVESYQLSGFSSVFSTDLSPFGDMPDGVSTWYGAENVPYEIFTLTGVSNHEIPSFTLGVNQLMRGRNFAEGERNAMVISSEFAEVNGLDIGSTVSVEALVFDVSGITGLFNWQEIFDHHIHDSLPRELEVVGIFETVAELSDEFRHSWEGISPALGMANTIYVPFSLIEELNAFRREAEIGLWGWSDLREVEGAYFLLSDSSYLIPFIETANNLLPSTHQIYTFSSTFGNLLVAFTHLRDIADWILYGAVFATIVILGLLMTLLLRERSYEVGIYLGLGEKKHVVFGQILGELFLNFTVALTLSIAVGNIFAGILTDRLIQDSLIQQEEDWNPFGFQGSVYSPLVESFFPGEMSQEVMLEAFDSSLDGLTITLIVLIGGTAVMASTLVPFLYLLHLSPKDVLLMKNI
ncbi:MAG: FtsX-like permease family protein [Turicibacter sp.]|nr:FtsX-like permease family protein [Turicibacter sp.]